MLLRVKAASINASLGGSEGPPGLAYMVHPYQTRNMEEWMECIGGAWRQMLVNVNISFDSTEALADTLGACGAQATHEDPGPANLKSWCANTL